MRGRQAGRGRPKDGDSWAGGARQGGRAQPRRPCMLTPERFALLPLSPRRAAASGGAGRMQAGRPCGRSAVAARHFRRGDPCRMLPLRPPVLPHTPSNHKPLLPHSTPQAALPLQHPSTHLLDLAGLHRDGARRGGASGASGAGAHRGAAQRRLLRGHACGIGGRRLGGLDERSGRPRGGRAQRAAVGPRAIVGACPRPGPWMGCPRARWQAGSGAGACKRPYLAPA